eukprot:588924-Prorocentrum_minimum.AAC.1
MAAFLEEEKPAVTRDSSFAPAFGSSSTSASAAKPAFAPSAPASDAKPAAAAAASFAAFLSASTPAQPAPAAAKPVVKPPGGAGDDDGKAKGLFGGSFSLLGPGPAASSAPPAAAGAGAAPTFSAGATAMFASITRAASKANSEQGAPRGAAFAAQESNGPEEPLPVFAFSSAGGAADAVKAISAAVGGVKSAAAAPKFTFGGDAGAKETQTQTQTQSQGTPSSAPLFAFAASEGWSSVGGASPSALATSPGEATPTFAFTVPKSPPLASTGSRFSDEEPAAKRAAPAAPVTGGWGADLLKANQEKQKEAAAAIEKEIEKTKGPDMGSGP